MTYKERYPVESIPKEVAEIAKYIGDGACNSMAIITELYKVSNLLREDFHAKGADWFNQHPALVIILEQLHYLSLRGQDDDGGTGDRFFEAADLIEAASEKEN
jgi:hypothetical protein